MTGEQLEAAAGLAERFGSGNLRRDGFAKPGYCRRALREHGRRWRANWARSGCDVEGSHVLARSGGLHGTEFCKLAIAETKGFTRWLVDELEERLPQFDQQLKLHVTGCPNSCGQHWIADIGLEGKKIKYEGKLTDAFYFCLGGAVGQLASVCAAGGVSRAGAARAGGDRAAAAQVPGGTRAGREFALVVCAPLERRIARPSCGRGACAGGARLAGGAGAACGSGVKQRPRKQREWAPKCRGRGSAGLERFRVDVAVLSVGAGWILLKENSLGVHRFVTQ